MLLSALLVGSIINSIDEELEEGFKRMCLEERTRRNSEELMRLERIEEERRRLENERRCLENERRRLELERRLKELRTY